MPNTSNTASAPPAKAHREMAEKLSKKLTKEQLIGIIDMLEHYQRESDYNVGVGHMLGALAAEISALLSRRA